jgi:hypothetical protein
MNLAPTHLFLIPTPPEPTPIYAETVRAWTDSHKVCDVRSLATALGHDGAGRKAEVAARLEGIA